MCKKGTPMPPLILFGMAPALIIHISIQKQEFAAGESRKEIFWLLILHVQMGFAASTLSTHPACSPI